jgi:hypothetical protein
MTNSNNAVDSDGIPVLQRTILLDGRRVERTYQRCCYNLSVTIADFVCLQGTCSDEVCIESIQAFRKELEERFSF